MLPSHSIHRESLIDILTNEIVAYASDENHPFYTAATRVILTWLGYNIEDVTFIDGKDNGIDAWFIADSNASSEVGIDVFQIKTHELSPDGLLNLKPFDNEAVNDLSRARSLLLYHDISNNPYSSTVA